jgi:bifunctional DNA-binding transcriptional regulator/antitoxin component of YhaV-PrlF toxin-antitoxin module
MRTLAMPEIRMRRKHQVTLPASIVREAGIKPDDMLTVTFMNGAIFIRPKIEATGPQDDLMSYAGIGRGVWGNTPDEIQASIRSLREE